MRKILPALPFALVTFASPAEATGGLVCRTAGAAPVEVSLGFGHVPGAPLIATRLADRGRQVPVSAPQWWLDQNEVRVILVSPQAQREEARIHARRNGHTYDGSLWRGGNQRWVRCREG
jgi:hypothetical protein